MKTKLLIAFCMVFALLSSAFAVTVSDVSFDSDDTFERSNPLLEGSNNELDDDKELEYVTFKIPVKADTGDINVTEVTLSSSFTYADLTDDNSADDIFVVTTDFPLTIANGTSKDISAKVLVPSNLDSVDSDLEALEHSFTVGVVTNESTENAKVSFYAENGLELSDVELITPTENIDCDVDDGSTELDCDNEIEELSPSEDFTLKFIVENMFDSDSDLDLDDTDIDLDSDNHDLDADDDSFTEDIDAEDEISFDVDFEVGKKVEDNDKATVTIQVSGEDVNGAKHGFTYEFTVKFELPKYDVQLVDSILSPSAICQGDSTKVSYTVENTGSKDQNNVRVQVKNTALSLNEVTERIELNDAENRDNDYDGEFVIDTTSSTKAGEYDIEFIVYYRDEDSNDATLFDRLSVAVQDCEGDDTQVVVEQPTEPPVVVIQQPTVPSEPTVIEPTPTTTPVNATVSKKANASTWAIAGLAIVILIVLILIGVIVAIMRK